VLASKDGKQARKTQSRRRPGPPRRSEASSRLWYECR
jgi:hypothetical protein